MKIIIFFVGLIAYMIWANGYYDGLSLQYLSTGFLIAAAAYVAISLFSLLSPSCGGLIALIGTVAGFFGIAWVMDKVSAAITWLDTERMLWIFTIITTVCMILNIRFIIRSMRQSKTAEKVLVTAQQGQTEKDDLSPAVKSSFNLKSQPELVLYYAGELEKELGRKPTTEEVLENIDHMQAFLLPYANELKKELEREPTMEEILNRVEHLQPRGLSDF